MGCAEVRSVPADVAESANPLVSQSVSQSFFASATASRPFCRSREGAGQRLGRQSAMRGWGDRVEKHRRPVGGRKEHHGKEMQMEEVYTGKRGGWARQGARAKEAKSKRSWKRGLDGMSARANGEEKAWTPREKRAVRTGARAERAEQRARAHASHESISRPERLVQSSIVMGRHAIQEEEDTEIIGPTGCSSS